jgi:hypothetical protein
MGSQKKARQKRLEGEITRYVANHPGCTASDIVAFLSIELRMKNHGLTPRKVGFFIPRHCESVTWAMDSSSGKRVYSLAD